MRAWLSTLRQRSELIAFALAVLLFIAGGLAHPGFASYGLAINILRLAAFLGIVAAGQTLVIIAGGEGIDLSVGSVVTLGAILVYHLSAGKDELAAPALLIALGAGALIGAVNGVGITLARIPPLVMTLGMSGVVQGMILAVTQGRLSGGTPPVVEVLVNAPFWAGIPGVLLIWAVVGIAMWLLLTRTPYGKYLFAVGANRVAARLSGVRVPVLLVLTYALSGLLAALAGVVLLGYIQRVFLDLGSDYTLPSVAAVVVGGTVLSGGQGGYLGTMAGALLLTILSSLLTTLMLPESVREIVFGLLLLLLLSAYGRQHRLRR
uniref:Monosaccharide-transporting ATPase n=1 Tax=Thermogemmatispora argillosa TaxID=2045280 RepID=A0A455T4B2_9CHLR|nr:monosaccharide-transporting ATPase [Thermogemmatispora argillosa]